MNDSSLFSLIFKAYSIMRWVIRGFLLLFTAAGLWLAIRFSFDYFFSEAPVIFNDREATRGDLLTILGFGLLSPVLFWGLWLRMERKFQTSKDEHEQVVTDN